MQETNNQFEQNPSNPNSPAPMQPESSWMNKMPEGGPVLHPPHNVILKKIVIALSLLLIVGLSILAYILFRTDKGAGIDIVIGAPDNFERGVPTIIDVSVVNNSGNGLSDAQINLSLPDDLLFVGTPGVRTVENRTVDLINDGESRKESFTVMASGEENTVRQIKAGISYVPGALSSRFEKTAIKDIVLSGEGLVLNFTSPAKVLAGEEFTVEVSYENKSSATYDDAQLLLTFPDGFTVKSIEREGLTPDTANLLNLGNLQPGALGKAIIKGFIVGQDDASFEIIGTISSRIGELRYDVLKKFGNVVLASSPLSLRIETDSLSSKFPSPGANLSYRLIYTNNTDIPLKDAIVQATLVGEMFDIKTLKTDGFLRSSDNNITWNASRVSSLSSLAPGATGVVTFSVQTKSAYPITRLSSKNYTLTVKGLIESPTVPKGIATKKTVGLAQTTNKMKGALLFSATGFYRDSSAGFINAGSIPATVGKPTQFTIHWTLKNTSTDVENITLKASLGANVKYTGKYKSSTDVGPTYNERTQEISWSVPKILATKGILSSPVELIFQVEFTPAIDQVGQYPELVTKTIGGYTDLFVGENSELEGNAITLALPDDLTTQNVTKAVKE